MFQENLTNRTLRRPYGVINITMARDDTSVLRTRTQIRGRLTHLIRPMFIRMNQGICLGTLLRRLTRMNIQMTRHDNNVLRKSVLPVVDISRTTSLNASSNNARVLILFPTRKLYEHEKLYQTNERQRQRLPSNVLRYRCRFLLIMELRRVIRHPCESHLPYVIRLVGANRRRSNTVSIYFSSLIHRLRPNRAQRFGIRRDRLQHFANGGFRDLSTIFYFVRTSRVSRVLLRDPTGRLTLSRFVLYRRRFTLRRDISSFSSNYYIYKDSGHAAMP